MAKKNQVVTKSATQKPTVAKGRSEARPPVAKRGESWTRSEVQNQIYNELIEFLGPDADGLIVTIKEEQSGKFVQFGVGCLEMDVPICSLTSEETYYACIFFRDLGEDYAREYRNPITETEVERGLTFNHDFGTDARAAAKAAVSFFEEVYGLPPDVDLIMETARSAK